MVWFTKRRCSSVEIMDGMFEDGDEEPANSGNDGNTPTGSAQKYILGELGTLEGLGAEEKALEYHNKSLELLAKDSNKSERLNKLLGEIETDGDTAALTKSDVLKAFAELCLVLKNAAEQDEKLEEDQQQALAGDYDKLFQRADSVKHQLEYEEAKQRGFDGDFAAYMELMVSQ